MPRETSGLGSAKLQNWGQAFDLCDSRRLVNTRARRVRIARIASGLTPVPPRKPLAGLFISKIAVSNAGYRPIVHRLIANLTRFVATLTHKIIRELIHAAYQRVIQICSLLGFTQSRIAELQA